MITATAAELQADFENYLNLVQSGQEILVTKDGRAVGRLVPAAFSPTDSLTGILKEEQDLDEEKERRLREKYL